MQHATPVWCEGTINVTANRHKAPPIRPCTNLYCDKILTRLIKCFLTYMRIGKVPGKKVFKFLTNPHLSHGKTDQSDTVFRCQSPSLSVGSRDVSTGDKGWILSPGKFLVPVSFRTNYAATGIYVVLSLG